MTSPTLPAYKALAAELEGEFHYDATMRTLYATDASVYRELPQAVALPKTEEDIRKLIFFARSHGTSLIPRTAGTSLAGQVVGGMILSHFGWLGSPVQPISLMNVIGAVVMVAGVFLATMTR